MKYVYNLPPLDNSSFPDPDRAGEWEIAGRLDDMASSLRLPTDQVEIDSLKSLPDPWARPLLFAQALTQAKHVAKDDARDQWRGLLALLALREFYANNYIIRILLTDLEDNSVGNQKFRNVLRTLSPGESLSPKADWRRIGIITYQKTSQNVFETEEARAIGLMVPNCLAAPARGARSIENTAVPWLRNGLRDPLKSEGMPSEQWVALYQYLSGIFMTLREPGLTGPVHQIRDEIKLFADECADRIRETGAIPYDVKFTTGSDELPSPFYACIDAIASPPEIAPGHASQTLIECAHDGDGPALGGIIKNVVLADPRIAEKTLGLQPQNVKIWNNYTLVDAQSPHLLDKIREEAGQEGHLVVEPDALLTDKLVKIDNDGRVEAHKPAWSTFLLPVSPLALFLIGRENIANQLSIDDRGDSLEVKLSIQLVSTDPRKPAPRHVIIRHYDKTKDVVAEALPEDIVLWPNVGNNDWPWTFLRYSYNTKLEMAPRFAASSQSLAALVNEQARTLSDKGMGLLYDMGSSKDLVFEKQVNFFDKDTGEIKDKSDKTIAHRFRFTDSESAIGEQHILGQSPDAIFFAVDPDGDGRHFPAGCMLLAKNTQSAQQGELDVAIDFGTTNTVVYMDSGAGAEPVKFSKRVTRPFSARVADAEQFAYDCVEFFPTSDVAMPFPTVMYQRIFHNSSRVASDSSNDLYHGITDNVFFMPQDVNMSLGYAIGRHADGQLVFNLKWDKDPEVRRMVRRFLRQLVLLICAEAIDRGFLPENIHWHFSYPQAWNYGQASDFRESAKLAWTDIMRPLVGRSKPSDEFLSFETEGAAALRYFTFDQKHQGQAGRTILMLDIGGGTTEIALYKRQRTIWRSSFQIAGGHFFTAFLHQNADFLHQIAGDEIQRNIQREAEFNPSSVDNRHVIELAISQPSFEASWDRNYPIVSSTDMGKGLRYTAVTALAGLLYYTGLALRAVIAAGSIQAKDLEDVTLAFAGRGASFFRYLGDANDPNSDLGQIVQILTDVALAKDEELERPVTEWNPSDSRFTGLFSPQPKHEVANGMLCERMDNRKPKRSEKYDIPLGEEITVLVDGELRTLDATTSISDLNADMELDDLGSQEFTNFLDILRMRLGWDFDIEGQNGVLARQIENSAETPFDQGLTTLGQSYSDEDSETLSIEPPFITKLRTLLATLSQDVETRKKAMRIRTGEPKW